MDSFNSSPVARKSMLGGRAKSAAGKAGSKGGANTEGKRAKRAEINKKVLFMEIKKLFDKAEEASQEPGGNPDPPLCKNFPSTTLSKCREDLYNKILLQ